jgi:hypothetical protein
MKLLILSLLSINCLASTINFSVLSPCDGSVENQIKEVRSFKNLSQASLYFLKKLNIPFIANEYSVESINNTPTGTDAYNVLSDNEMHAYGWCYTVNGIAPEVMPSDFKLSNSVDYTIEWHYGYARYLNGSWITQCSAAWLIKPNFVCHNDK